jgi:hypothetical protein
LPIATIFTAKSPSRREPDCFSAQFFAEFSSDEAEDQQSERPTEKRSAMPGRGTTRPQRIIISRFSVIQELSIYAPSAVRNGTSALFRRSTVTTAKYWSSEF